MQLAAGASIAGMGAVRRLKVIPVAVLKETPMAKIRNSNPMSQNVSDVDTAQWLLTNGRYLERYGLLRRRLVPFYGFHPEMALFPLSVVLRGFPPAAYYRVGLGEKPCAA